MVDDADPSSGADRRSARPSIVGEGSGFYHLMVERDLGAVAVEGDVEAVRAMLAALPTCRTRSRSPRGVALARAEVVEPAGLPADADADATRLRRKSSR